MPVMARKSRPSQKRPQLPEGEERITLKAAAARLIPPRPTSTVYKWATQGVSGVRLEVERQAALMFTSAEAIERFLDQASQ